VEQAEEEHSGQPTQPPCPPAVGQKGEKAEEEGEPGGEKGKLTRGEHASGIGGEEKASGKDASEQR